MFPILKHDRGGRCHENASNAFRIKVNVQFTATMRAVDRALCVDVSGVGPKCVDERDERFHHGAKKCWPLHSQFKPAEVGESSRPGAVVWLLRLGHVFPVEERVNQKPRG